MLDKESKEAILTFVPLGVTALALWATRAAYEAYFFEALRPAQFAGFMVLCAVHLFAPIWAGTRRQWFAAALLQLGLVAVHYYLFFQLALTRPHDFVPSSGCGLAGGMFLLLMLGGFLLYIPFALLTARGVHKKSVAGARDDSV